MLKGERTKFSGPFATSPSKAKVSALSAFAASGEVADHEEPVTERAAIAQSSFVCMAVIFHSVRRMATPRVQTKVP
jgi:hypothetical protein